MRDGIIHVLCKVAIALINLEIGRQQNIQNVNAVEELNYLANQVKEGMPEPK